jgi:hypothetical protein
MCENRSLGNRRGADAAGARVGADTVNYKPKPMVGAMIALVVLAGVAVGVIAARRQAGLGRSNADLPGAFQYDIEKLKKIDPALMAYRQTAEWSLALNEPRGLAVGPDDRVVVVGDRAAAIFQRDGKGVASFPVSQEPRCVAVGGVHHAHPGRIYVGLKDRVEVYEASGKRLAAWEPAGKRPAITSIAVGEDDVAVADAGSRLVRIYDVAGKLRREIGKPDEASENQRFIIPSPYFDVAFSSDGLLRVANTGAHRIEGYTLDGHRETAWGKQGDAIEGFCGCCNPAHFALLPDGRYVTVEKGLPRVKVYSAAGEFESVVAGPEQLAQSDTIVEETRDDVRQPVFDVATDSRGRILVLDPGVRKVRVFEPKGTTP